MSDPNESAPLRGAACLRRLFALAYDGLLVSALLIVTLTPVFAVTLSIDGNPPPRWVVQSLVLVITFCFYAAFWTRWGRTLGSQSWRLRILTAAGTPPSLRQAAIRYFVSIPSALLFFAGYLWALVDRHKRSWPDIASGTTTIYLPDPPKTASR